MVWLDVMVWMWIHCVSVVGWRWEEVVRVEMVEESVVVGVYVARDFRLFYLLWGGF